MSNESEINPPPLGQRIRHFRDLAYRAEQASQENLSLAISLVQGLIQSEYGDEGSQNQLSDLLRYLTAAQAGFSRRQELESEIFFIKQDPEYISAVRSLYDQIRSKLLYYPKTDLGNISDYNKNILDPDLLRKLIAAGQDPTNHIIELFREELTTPLKNHKLGEINSRQTDIQRIEEAIKLRPELKKKLEKLTKEVQKTVSALSQIDSTVLSNLFSAAYSTLNSYNSAFKLKYEGLFQKGINDRITIEELERIKENHDQFKQFVTDILNVYHLARFKAFIKLPNPENTANLESDIITNIQYTLTSLNTQTTVLEEGYLSVKKIPDYQKLFDHISTVISFLKSLTTRALNGEFVSLLDSETEIINNQLPISTFHFDFQTPQNARKLHRLNTFKQETDEKYAQALEADSNVKEAFYTYVRAKIGEQIAELKYQVLAEAHPEIGYLQTIKEGSFFEKYEALNAKIQEIELRLFGQLSCNIEFNETSLDWENARNLPLDDLQKTYKDSKEAYELAERKYAYNYPRFLTLRKSSLLYRYFQNKKLKALKTARDANLNSLKSTNTDIEPQITPMYELYKMMNQQKSPFYIIFMSLLKQTNGKTSINNFLRIVKQKADSLNTNYESQKHKITPDQESLLKLLEHLSDQKKEAQQASTRAYSSFSEIYNNY